jgi:hypothetical protein
MEKITTSFELSKELKENGFKQDSICFFCDITHSHEKPKMSLCIKTPFVSERDKISAPTAEELLEELPEKIIYSETFKQYWYLKINIHNQYGFNVSYGNYNTQDKKLCNALAKMWLYLKKNNLLEGK